MVAVANALAQSFTFNSIANGAAKSEFFTNSNKVRILNMTVVSEAAIAAHSTAVYKVELLTGATVIGKVTNDSDESTTTATTGVVGIDSALYAAKTTRSIAFTQAGANSDGAYENAADAVLEIKASNDTGGTITDVTVHLEYTVSD
tara:strand:+ start:848 stop:1285 length:438 start_codon:yes stop_codon:yes gene_type:complete